MLVSILIPTLLERLDTFNPMVRGLYKQIKDNNLEKKVETFYKDKLSGKIDISSINP